MAVDDEFDLLNWTAFPQHASAGGGVRVDLSVPVDNGFSTFLDMNLTAISRESDPNIALNLFTELATATNQLVQKDPRLIKWLNRNTSKFANSARNLAVKVGAESFTISVGAPAGVSVSFTFAIS